MFSLMSPSKFFYRGLLVVFESSVKFISVAREAKDIERDL